MIHFPEVEELLKVEVARLGFGRILAPEHFELQFGVVDGRTAIAIILNGRVVGNVQANEVKHRPVLRLVEQSKEPPPG